MQIEARTQYTTRSVLSGAQFKDGFDFDDSGSLDAPERQPLGGTEGPDLAYGVKTASTTIASRGFLINLNESCF